MRGSRRAHKGLKAWLIEQIDSGRYPGLCWEDGGRSLFRLPWKHASKHDYSHADSALFRAWAEHKGRFRAGVDRPDPPSWKTRLRCAMNKSRDFVEEASRGQSDISQPYRVFRVLTTRSPAHRPPLSPGSSAESPGEDVGGDDQDMERSRPTRTPLYSLLGLREEAASRVKTEENAKPGIVHTDGVFPDSLPDPSDLEELQRELGTPAWALRVSVSYRGRELLSTTVTDRSGCLLASGRPTDPCAAHEVTRTHSYAKRGATVEGGATEEGDFPLSPPSSSDGRGGGARGPPATVALPPAGSFRDPRHRRAAAAFLPAAARGVELCVVTAKRGDRKRRSLRGDGRRTSDAGLGGGAAGAGAGVYVRRLCRARVFTDDAGGGATPRKLRRGEVTRIFDLDAFAGELRRFRCGESAAEPRTEVQLGFGEIPDSHCLHKRLITARIQPLLAVESLKRAHSAMGGRSPPTLPPTPPPGNGPGCRHSNGPGNRHSNGPGSLETIMRFLTEEEGPLPAPPPFSVEGLTCDPIGLDVAV